jgi:hypothetical protein
VKLSSVPELAGRVGLLYGAAQQVGSLVQMAFGRFCLRQQRSEVRFHQAGAGRLPVANSIGDQLTADARPAGVRRQPSLQDPGASCPDRKPLLSRDLFELGYQPSDPVSLAELLVEDGAIEQR